MQIEEEIEEVTEFYTADEAAVSESNRTITKLPPKLSSTPAIHSVDFALKSGGETPDEDGPNSKSVAAFPEFGVDIVTRHNGE